MPYKNNFLKMLPGKNLQVLIAKATAYTNDATYILFQANALEGEMGVFKTADNTAYTGLAAAAATEEIFIAVKRDGNIERTVPFKLGNVLASRTAYEAPVKQVTNVVLTAAVLTAGTYCEIGITDLTIGSQPFPTYNYAVKAVAGETADTMGPKLVAAINDTASKANKDRDLIVTASYVAGTDTLTLTAIDFGVNFRIQLRQGLSALTAVYTTAMKLGSGFAAQVKLFQDAGDIYKGVTTNFPKQGTVPENYGKPTDSVSTALNYHLDNFTGYGEEASRTPLKKAFFDRNILVAIPTAGGPETEVKLILGL